MCYVSNHFQKAYNSSPMEHSQIFGYGDSERWLVCHVHMESIHRYELQLASNKSFSIYESSH